MPPKSHSSTAARQAPPSKQQLIHDLVGFAAERIAVSGGVVKEDFAAAGYDIQTVETLGPDIRAGLLKRGLLQAAA